MSNSDDDLTTDAIPMPPRNEPKEDQSENREETEHIKTQPKTKTKKVFGKIKKPHTAFASVINISHANGIHIGSNYNVYLNNKSGPNPQREEIVTDAIKALFNNSEPIERKHIIFVSPHINEEWRTTARLLDYSDGQISQFEDDYIKRGIKEVIYQLLLDWKQNEADAATVGKLATTLWNTSQQDAVKRWCENFTK